MEKCLLNCPLHKKPPTVLMKMDIEGSEVEVLPDMLWRGAMSHIDRVLIEFHTRLVSHNVFRMGLSLSLPLLMKVMAPKLIYRPADDEKYMFYNFKGGKKPFPKKEEITGTCL